MLKKMIQSKLCSQVVFLLGVQLLMKVLHPNLLIVRLWSSSSSSFICLRTKIIYILVQGAQQFLAMKSWVHCTIKLI